MDRSRFREFLYNSFDMTDDILLDRIFKYFDSDSDEYYYDLRNNILKITILNLNEIISIIIFVYDYLYLLKVPTRAAGS